MSAASPDVLDVATQADFLKGDVEDLSIDSDGRVFLGPSPALVAETAAPFLWTVAGAARRHAVRGIRQRRQGPARSAATARCRRSSTLRSSKCTRMAAAPGGGLYVATSPDGKIYQVAADGTSKTFFDPDDKYIWALAVDRTGNVFAATGDKGVIYRITPDGRGRRFYKTNTTNVVSLAVAPVRRSDRRHRIARPGLSSSMRRARRSCCSTRRSARFTRYASPPTGRSMPPR